MTKFAIITIDPDLHRAKDLIVAWNTTPETQPLGQALDEGPAAGFPLDPATVGGAIVVALVAGVGVEALKGAIRVLFSSHPEAPSIKIKVEPAQGDAISVTVTRS